MFQESNRAINFFEERMTRAIATEYQSQPAEFELLKERFAMWLNNQSTFVKWNKRYVYNAKRDRDNSVGRPGAIQFSCNI